MPCRLGLCSDAPEKRTKVIHFLLLYPPTNYDSHRSVCGPLKLNLSSLNILSSDSLPTIYPTMPYHHTAAVNFHFQSIPWTLCNVMITIRYFPFFADLLLRVVLDFSVDKCEITKFLIETPLRISRKLRTGFQLSIIFSFVEGCEACEKLFLLSIGCFGSLYVFSVVVL